MLLQQAQSEKRISGIKICRGAQAISDLLFADDSLLFCKANQREAGALRALMLQYEAMPGQKINLFKSHILFNVLLVRRQLVTSILGIPEEENLGLYLGMPTKIG